MVPITLIHWSWEDAFDPAGFNGEKRWNGLDSIPTINPLIVLGNVRPVTPEVAGSSPVSIAISFNDLGDVFKSRSIRIPVPVSSR